MTPLSLRALGAAACVMVLGACVSGSDVAEKRANVQKMRADTLSKLYAHAPQAREQIRKSVGYAVFSNVGVYVIWLSGGGGWGVLHDNRSGKDTYMRMGSVGVGIGLGVKDFRGVFVFTDAKWLDRFAEHGLDLSGQADAAAKAGEKGGAWAGAIDVAPGIKLYQLTESGLALQATIQGTKYWKDSELN